MTTRAPGQELVGGDEPALGIGQDEGGHGIAGLQRPLAGLGPAEAGRAGPDRRPGASRRPGGRRGAGSIRLQGTFGVPVLLVDPAVEEYRRIGIAAAAMPPIPSDYGFDSCPAGCSSPAPASASGRRRARGRADGRRPRPARYRAVPRDRPRAGRRYRPRPASCSAAERDAEPGGDHLADLILAGAAVARLGPIPAAARAAPAPDRNRIGPLAHDRLSFASACSWNLIKPARGWSSGQRHDIAVARRAASGRGARAASPGSTRMALSSSPAIMRSSSRAEPASARPNSKPGMRCCSARKDGRQDPRRERPVDAQAQRLAVAAPESGGLRRRALRRAHGPPPDGAAWPGPAR